MKNLYLFLCLLLCGSFSLQAQDQLNITGNLEANGNFFLRDSLIGADNTPQYDYQLYGADVWMNLAANYKGFSVGLRFDAFQNSNLLNPTGSYSDQGIGRWYVKKKMEKLEISAGYLYDQIGAGLIFRAYEQRPLLIDQALYGLRLNYNLTPDWQVKVFSGKQKRQFDRYEAVIKGASIDGYIGFGEESKLSLAPGIGVVARTLDDETMDKLVNAIAGYRQEDQVKPKYNTYAATLYNTLSYGGFTWYAEGALKSSEVFRDPFQTRITNAGGVVTGSLVNREGLTAYTSLGYAGGGFGISVEAKRTSNFDFRADPLLQFNNGQMNFLPPMARVNAYRLTARYAPATQFIGEQAYQADISYAPSRKLRFLVNGSYIDDLEGNDLYRELFTEVTYKYKRKWQLVAGVQFQDYNQEIYLTKPQEPNIKTFVPYFDFLYKFSRKKALRLEGQYMGVNEKDGVKVDFGNWIFGLAEVTLAPHWTFTVSDMYNVGPGKLSPTDERGEKLKIHYPRFDVFYTYKSNRFSLSYVKQVEGIVCSGGICRLEPAFSGVKMTVNSTF